MRRPRGPGGRFLTASEIAEMEKNKSVGAEGVEKHAEVNEDEREDEEEEIEEKN